MPYIHLVLPSYGLLAFVGGFFAIVFLFVRLEKYGIEFVEFLRLFIVSILGGLIGSKFLFAITQIPWFINNFSWPNLILLIPRSGFVYYGGLFGVLGALWLVSGSDLKKRNNFYKFIIPSIPLFHCFGRIGCMMAGCCYGVDLDNHIYIGFFEFSKAPVQLIEAVFEFLMFLTFLDLEKRNSKLYSLSNYILTYAVFRFFIEFFRGDIVRGIWAGLSTSQYISFFIIMTVLVSKLKNNKKQEENG